MSIVIVGAGQAGAEVASSLRQGGYAEAITLIGSEPWAPYRRPPLSKTFLAGKASRDSLQLKPAGFYEKQQIELRLGQTVTAIDRHARTVQLAGGERLAYRQLVLATGGRARPLNLPGAAAAPIHLVRTLDDIERLQPAFRPGQRLLIVGGGYIGLEVAAVAVEAGLSVTVLEAAPRLLARVAAPVLSSFYEQVHRERGVRIVTGAQLSGIETDAGTLAVQLADGQRHEADLIVAGIGLLPNTELAEAAGLALDNGIATDAYGQTSDPDIFAAGDCASHPNPLYGRRLRLESVPNALEQARAVAQTLLGKPQPYAPVPWFWSDQYDLKLQMAGLNEGYDQVVLRGDPQQRQFSAFYLRAGQVLAADSVNRPQEHQLAKRLVGERRILPAAALADESVALKSLVEGSA
ncbi:MAG TPA: FAD-dependent oxidoreductase [Nevskiaceae bacterium]|nr:FAD-dependent oxidoreductase [Nevskiaceae bacterium]